MRKLLAIDPGWATGLSVWRVPEDGPIERESYFLTKDGPVGFDAWFKANAWGDVLWGPEAIEENPIIVCEKYIDDGRAIQPDPNALLIEGYLMGAWGIDEIVFQRNSMKNTKAGDKLLKQHGLEVTGKQVRWSDGRDVNDSQLHAIAWAKNHHRPSQEFFWPKGR